MLLAMICDLAQYVAGYNLSARLLEQMKREKKDSLRFNRADPASRIRLPGRSFQATEPQDCPLRAYPMVSVTGREAVGIPPARAAESAAGAYCEE